MTSGQFKISTFFRLALLLGALALFASAATPPGGQADQQIPPAPTVRPKTAPPPAQKPTATPATPSPSPAEEEDEEVIRVASNLVVVPTSVTDDQGEVVPGLKATDFRLEEEGRAQAIAQVGDAEQVPLDIAVIFDVSSSVSERFEFEQQAAARFLKQVLKPIDRAAVFSLSEKPKLERSLTSAESASLKLMAIPSPKGPTPTAFYDAVIAASRYLAQHAPARNRRVIIVISDGEDNYSESIREASIAEARGEMTAATARGTQMARHRKALLEVQREVQRSDAVFYSINPSGQALRLNKISARAQDGMAQLAEVTGGAAFVPEELKDLDAVFRRIAAELRSQYLLQYYSNNNAPPGKFLGIKVRAPARPDVRIRARQGYYVPQPK